MPTTPFSAGDTQGIEPPEDFMEYPDKVRVIRSSMRAGFLGILCVCLPPISWTCCRAAWAELAQSVLLSGDPLLLQHFSRRHFTMGLVAALTGLCLGPWLGLLLVILFCFTELVVVIRGFTRLRPRKFNPARIHLYLGVALTSVAQIQAVFVALNLLGLLVHLLTTGFQR